MSWKTMTIGRKLAWAFGVILLLLGLVSYLSITGVDSVVDNATEVIDGNKLDANLAQREIEHLNWAGQVSTLFNDEHVSELSVQTDPHKCAFGQWYHSDERKTIQENFPELTGVLEALNEPHNRLHESAIKIDETFKQPHSGLSLKLEQVFGKHLEWYATVATALSNAQSGEDFTLNVSVDPESCALGQFLNNPETQKVLAEFPELANSIEAMRKPHADLHRSAIQIEALIKEGKLEEAREYFATKTSAHLNDVRKQFDNAIAAEEKLSRAFAEAQHIYNTETTPALYEVQKGLNELRKQARSYIMTDEAMLSAGNRTRISVAIIAIIAAIGGIILAVLIGRNISKALRLIASSMTDSSCQVSAAANQVSGGSQSLAQGAAEQAASLEETSASLEEINSMTRSNAERSNEADQLTNENQQTVSRTREDMDKLAASMQAISESSTEMQKIIKSIDEIAFQTNLLALNAAVEAARAGEAGAGFAVVADEVRNLAMRAAEAAKSTSSLIEESEERVRNGSELVSKSTQGFTEVNESITRIAEIISEIKSASHEQATGIDQVSRGVTEIDKTTQSAAANAEESAAASEELNAQAMALQTQVAELMAMVQNGNHSVDARKPERPKPQEKGFYAQDDGDFSVQQHDRSQTHIRQ